MQQGVDSRALFAVFIRNLPSLFLLAVAGAVLGSGLNLLVALVQSRDPVYVSETEYYIEFAEGRYEARDWYNDFTWNDVLATDLILGRAMELLGGGYDRAQVGESITADILSDVRYLTITVRGENPHEVGEIKDALQTALEEFGAQKREFDSIYRIEDLGIVLEEPQYFVWRAAFLGAVLFLCAGSFVTAFRFCMGSAFYTKGDMTKILGLPAYGMTFRGKGTEDALVKKQAKMLEKNLGLLTDRYAEVFLMDASDGRYAEAFLRDIINNRRIDSSRLKLYDTEQDFADAAILAVIPFGKTYRERITDEMDYACLHGGRIEGAVLTGADRIWGKIYYAFWGKKEGNRE